MDGYESIMVKGKTKQRLISIMKKTTTYDNAVNVLIDEHIHINKGVV